MNQISFVIEEFNKCGFSKLIDNHFCIRYLTGYQYSEIFRSWFSVFFSGGDVAEDIKSHLRESLSAIPGNRVPSADILLRGIKELSTGNTTVNPTFRRFFSPVLFGERPAKPVRLMAGLLLLKHIRDLSDATLHTHLYKPVNPSVQIKSISLRIRFFMSLNLDLQEIPVIFNV
jgi:hypothetical protein